MTARRAVSSAAAFISNDGCDVSVAGKLFHTRAPATAIYTQAVD